MGADGHVLVYSRRLLARIFRTKMDLVWDQLSQCGYGRVPDRQSCYSIDEEAWAEAEHWEGMKKHLILYWDTENYDFPEIDEFHRMNEAHVLMYEVAFALWDDFDINNRYHCEILVERVEENRENKVKIEINWLQEHNFFTKLAIRDLQIWT